MEWRAHEGIPMKPQHKGFHILDRQLEPSIYDLWTKTHFNHPLSYRWRNLRTGAKTIRAATEVLVACIKEMKPLVIRWAVREGLNVDDYVEYDDREKHPEWFAEDSP